MNELPPWLQINYYVTKMGAMCFKSLLLKNKITKNKIKKTEKDPRGFKPRISKVFLVHQLEHCLHLKERNN